MKVRHGEGLANHIGPEPCAVVREDLGEASAGDRIGQPLSREIDVFLGADAVLLAEGNMGGRVIASARTARRGLRPWHVWTLLVREPGDSHVQTRTVRRSWPASGRRGAVAGDVRA